MSDSEILSQLKGATRGLRYISESDRPVKPFLWGADKTGNAVDAETAVRHAKQLKPDVLTKTRTLAEFFAPMLNEYPGQPDEEIETAKRFRQLQGLLTQLLSGVTVFRIGDEPDIPVYVIGKTAEGNWAGVETVLVET